MKKLLTIIGAISLISTPAISVVGCFGNDENNDNDDHNDHNDNGNNNDDKNIVDVGLLLSTPTKDEIKELIREQFGWKYSLREENMEVGTVTNYLAEGPNGVKVAAIDFRTNKVVTLELKWTIVRVIPTKYIDSVGKERQTDHKDLSELEVTKITKIGYYQIRNGGIQAVRMPKTVTEVPSYLPQRITSLKGVFEDITSEQVKGIEKWYVGRVKGMGSMFSGASNFNQDISNWDVGNVERMDRMFYGAHNFKQDISSWDVANVKHMYRMFYSASNFNQDISNWDVARVISWTDFATDSPIGHNKDKLPAKFR